MNIDDAMTSPFFPSIIFSWIDCVDVCLPIWLMRRRNETHFFFLSFRRQFAVHTCECQSYIYRINVFLRLSESAIFIRKPLEGNCLVCVSTGNKPQFERQVFRSCVVFQFAVCELKTKKNHSCSTLPTRYFCHLVRHVIRWLASHVLAEHWNAHDKTMYKNLFWFLSFSHHRFWKFRQTENFINSIV